ncbi:hypothetical protein ZIOFF_038750 [Zingiber officinale]|uniref:Uncharacterized protein n=1 Tax=Zingiber officinale TaxID=94328 RepID=A0A8J5GA83_ZINOF|nr:hypothetical protein ZIOFF_038750 [Zingiber officinale]
MPVNHCLFYLPGAPPFGALPLSSEPRGAQSRSRRGRQRCRRRPLHGGESHCRQAVIGSRIAACEFGLRVPDPNFQDRQLGGDFNRYLKLGLSSAATASSAAAEHKTTLAFALHGGPSDLFSTMWIFESHCVRVARVDHRLNRKRPLRIVDRAKGKVVYLVLRLRDGCGREHIGRRREGRDRALDRDRRFRTCAR